MANIKELQVQVTYKVGLSNLKMPQKVKLQLIEAYENSKNIVMEGQPEYLEAADWISQNIKEGDCFNWEAEIEIIDL